MKPKKNIPLDRIRAGDLQVTKFQLQPDALPTAPQGVLNDWSNGDFCTL